MRRLGGLTPTRKAKATKKSLAAEPLNSAVAVLGVTLLVLVPVFAGLRTTRPLGGIFVALYAGFITIQYVGFLKP